MLYDIFNLLENFVDNNNKHYLNISAKYHSFNINDAHTMSPSNIVSHPAEVIWLTAFFLNSKPLFIQHLCWPLAGQPGVSAH